MNNILRFIKLQSIKIRGDMETKLRYKSCEARIFPDNWILSLCVYKSICKDVQLK